MIKIGRYNTLPVKRLVDFGAYLDGGNEVEILLPARYIQTPPEPGDMLEVFIYTDSEDRLIATTEHPLIQVGEFAFLQAVDCNPRIGTFLDWGLLKNLLCPFSEQRTRMTVGHTYPVYAYLDHNTKRVVASAKIDKFLGNKIPDYKTGDEVTALIYRNTDIGYAAIVDNLFHGMLYHNELYSQPGIGDTVKAYVTRVRPDGKIDISLKGHTGDRVHELAGRIIKRMQARGGESDITDESSPEEIKAAFGCSKKDFKRAIGYLFKNRKVTIEPHRLLLAATGSPKAARRKWTK